MSRIHYFPRYSQKENMVTNNTLLLFSRLYNNNAEKFKRFINTLLEKSNVELDTTVKFSQQEKTKESVPDGVIQQESFKIIIETKLYGQQNLEQVERHINAFEDQDKKIFLWVNTEPINDEYKRKIVERLDPLNIKFASTTFKEICRCFNEVLNEYDFEMKELIQDFETFCFESGLIDNADTKMRVVLSGTSYEQNMMYGMYYAPSDRGYQKHKYLGLYKDKAVRGIGEVISIADISFDWNSHELTIENILLGEIKNEQKESVKKVIIEAKKEFGFDISQGHRFFFVERFYETNYIKPTKGGLMGQKYFDLTDIDGFSKEMSTEQIAELLRGKEWVY